MNIDAAAVATAVGAIATAGGAIATAFAARATKNSAEATQQAAADTHTQATATASAAATIAEQLLESVRQRLDNNAPAVTIDPELRLEVGGWSLNKSVDIVDGDVTTVVAWMHSSPRDPSMLYGVIARVSGTVRNIGQRDALLSGDDDVTFAVANERGDFHFDLTKNSHLLPAEASRKFRYDIPLDIPSILERQKIAMSTGIIPDGHLFVSSTSDETRVDQWILRAVATVLDPLPEQGPDEFHWLGDSNGRVELLAGDSVYYRSRAKQLLSAAARAE